MGAWLLGLLPKFAANFLAGIFKDWRRDRALTEKGRVEEKLNQAEKTVEVISRNVEGQNAVDEMTEQESIEDLTKP
jgi:hypothetical protein